MVLNSILLLATHIHVQPNMHLQSKVNIFSSDLLPRKDLHKHVKGSCWQPSNITKYTCFYFSNSAIFELLVLNRWAWLLGVLSALRSPGSSFQKNNILQSYPASSNCILQNQKPWVRRSMQMSINSSLIMHASCLRSFGKFLGPQSIALKIRSYKSLVTPHEARDA